MDSELPPLSAPLETLPPPVGPAARLPWYHWRRFGRDFLTLSLVVHLLLGIGAAYFVVAVYHPKKKLFGPAPGGSKQAAEHKVSLASAQKRSSAPAALKRVTTLGLSPVALPVMPTVPTDQIVAPIGLRGMSGQGLGLDGNGAGGNGNGAGGGRGVSLFGFHGKGGGGLEGTFYDYKADQDFHPLRKFDGRTFGTMVREMLPANGTWHPEGPFPHFVSPAKLRGRYFFFPAIQDTGAGAAFESPRSGPGHWLAVYRGAISAPTEGSYRFVGFGDNVMIVQLGNHMVLDASDNGYTGQRREPVGEVRFPKKRGTTPLFAGEWFNLSAGEPKDIAIAIGDEGGIFCSGLFIQPRETTYSQGGNGIPNLPLFALGALTDTDKQLLGRELPASCLQGPFFTAVAARPAETSIFSH